MSQARSISADFPYTLHYIEVHGSKLHYVDEGSGDPILFLHGNPTSSYLWRNIFPYVTPLARGIAHDLIGMGKSEKPDIEYRFFDHVTYVEGFIELMGLKNITLVIHDWGSALDFHYAMRHENNMKGLAFMEAIMAPAPSWEVFPAESKALFKAFRTPGVGPDCELKYVHREVFAGRGGQSTDRGGDEPLPGALQGGQKSQAPLALAERNFHCG